MSTEQLHLVDDPQRARRRRRYAPSSGPVLHPPGHPVWHVRYHQVAQLDGELLAQLDAWNDACNAGGAVHDSSALWPLLDEWHTAMQAGALARVIDVTAALEDLFSERP